MTHVAIAFLRKVKGKAKEHEVVMLIWLSQLAVGILALLTYAGKVPI